MGEKFTVWTSRRASSVIARQALRRMKGPSLRSYPDPNYGQSAARAESGLDIDDQQQTGRLGGFLGLRSSRLSYGR
jgi:hypothetical protein